jgi:hypothetical protein
MIEFVVAYAAQQRSETLGLRLGQRFDQRVALQRRVGCRAW